MVFRPTHARFDVDLLDDCRTEFLRVTTALDGYLELADRLRGERGAAVVAYAPGNRENLIAGAAYAQWISDHISQQTARWLKADKAAAAGYSTDSDETDTAPTAAGRGRGGRFVGGHTAVGAAAAAGRAEKHCDAANR
jgi:hypothetical protein